MPWLPEHSTLTTDVQPRTVDHTHVPFYEDILDMPMEGIPADKRATTSRERTQPRRSTIKEPRSSPTYRHGSHIATADQLSAPTQPNGNPEWTPNR